MSSPRVYLTYLDMMAAIARAAAKRTPHGCVIRGRAMPLPIEAPPHEVVDHSAQPMTVLTPANAIAFN
jgi:hypothetical protein